MLTRVQYPNEALNLAEDLKTCQTGTPFTFCQPINLTRFTGDAFAACAFHRRIMNFMTMMSSEVLVGRTDLAYGTRVPRKSWIFEGNPHYLYQRMVIHSARMAKPIMYYQYHATYHIFCARLALCMLMHVDTLYVHTHIHKITSRYLCIPVQIKYDIKKSKQ